MTIQLHAEPFSRDFYVRNPIEVASGLLGALLIHWHPVRGLLAGKIVETEAYWGETDLACHASMGRTRRNEPMYGRQGHAYIYLIYGMHSMLNVVTEPEGTPSAVLVRAVEPIVGITRATDGPGKLTRAMEIDTRLNCADVTRPPLCIAPYERVTVDRIDRGSRVGVEYAGQWAHKPWRFFIRGSRWVSKPRSKGIKRS